jgi:tRNA(Ile)-lysidine synthase
VSERAIEAARESGLVRPGEPLLVLLSGGADSTCLIDVAARLEARVSALHVNYGLREGADADEAHCRGLCERLGVGLHVERAGAAPDRGNLQAWARELRYAHAERLAAADYAAAHTASDQAETVLYRLATSPGRRALLGMEPRRGRLVRPLLRATREDTRAYCDARGLDWREDPSNEDLRFARARVRHELLPAFRTVGPAAERTIAETSLLLREEAEVLERALDQAASRLVAGAAVPLAELRREPPAIQRLLLRRMAESASGRELALSREDCDRVLALEDPAGTRALDLGDGLRAVVEYGTLRFVLGPEAPAPEPVELTVPGQVRFGEWDVEARLGGEGETAVSGDAVSGILTVRAWRDGDRMRPAGLGGTKTLQDLFTDRKVPRALRRTLPVVEAGGEVIWVAGLVTDERFVAPPGPGSVGLSARQATDTLRP